MAAIAEPLLMTVEQYRELPQRDDVIQELHWGQLVTLTRPKMRHTKLQYRLVEMLRPLLQRNGVVASEIPFRALPQYELRGADVAFVSHRRWEATDDEDNLQGSPELVIEVLSRSNTQAKMREKAALYLSTGCQEFWVINPKRKEVSVTRCEGGTTIYDAKGQISSVLFAGVVNVAEIFS
jgi:Uma2 family endonuclease